MTTISQLEQEILSYLPPKTRPRIWEFSGGTGIHKIMQGVKESGIIDRWPSHVEVTHRIQSESEQLKLNGDTTLSHIIHRTATIVGYDSNDFDVMNLSVPPEMRQDYDKLWNGGSRESIFDLLNLWLNKNSHLYVGNIVNDTVNRTLIKFANMPVAYDPARYNNRTCFGGYVRTAIESIARYNQIVYEFQLADFLREQGIYLIESNSEILKSEGFKGKQDLNKYFEAQVLRYKAEQKNYPNGYIVLAPSWAYAGRSMSQVTLDYTLDLTNSKNSQERDRDMTALPMGNICTLDNKEKLIGCQIRAPFVTHESTPEREIDEYILDFYNEVKTAHGDRLPNHWRMGINLAKRVLGTASYSTTTDMEIDQIINSSKRILRDCQNKVDFNILLRNPDMLEILKRVKTDSSLKIKTSILDKVAKKTTNPNNPTSIGPSNTKMTKSDERLLKEAQRQIVDTLVGGGTALASYMPKSNRVTIFDAIKSKNSDLDLSKAFEKKIGVTPDEYLKIVSIKDQQGNYAFPITEMNNLINLEE
jgi:hypothetical protein